MKYAHLNGNKVVGWYDSDIHETIPEPNVEISYETWQAATQSDANWYEDGIFTYHDDRDSAEIDEELSQIIRRQRSRLLTEADAIVNTLEDNGHSSAAARLYRQALRDVPEQVGFPNDVSWPEKP